MDVSLTRNRVSFQKLWLRWPYLSLAGLLYSLFLWLITTTPTISYSITELNSLDGLRGFDGVERITTENKQVLAYSWVRPNASLNFRNLPRYAPLELSLDASLARPANAPPARLEIILTDDTETITQTLTTVQFDPNQPGFNRYTVTIPTGNPPGEPGFTVQLLSNGFQADGRELGVRISTFQVRALTGWREEFFWPNPYVVAVLLFTVGLVGWCIRLRLGWLESALFIGFLLLAVAESAQYMQAHSWWLLGCALVLILSAWLYGKSSWPFGLFQFKSPLDIGPILLASFAAIGFFISSWPAVYDTNSYVNWNNQIAQYGPFGIYAHSDNLNYPPLIVYLLWLYGLVVNPLGWGGSYAAIKFLFSLSVPALVWIVWRNYSRQRQPPANLPAISLLLGLSAGALYSPAVYGQADAPLVLLLVWAFLVINRGQARWGAVLLALSLLYKFQAIYLLPVLLALMVRRSGWRATLLAALPAALVALVLTPPAFGFSWNQFSQFWQTGQLAGEGLLEYGGFNFLDLLNANNGQVGWVVPFGFGIITLVYLVLLFGIWRGSASPRMLTLACALALLVCFMFGIKVKQHYLYYPLPFLGLAALFDRRLLNPWLLLGGVYTLMLIVSPVLSRRGIIFDNFLTWNRLLKAGHPVVEDGLIVSGLFLFGGLLAFYLWRDGRELFSPQTADEPNFEKV